MFYISVSNIDTNNNKIEGKIQKERRETEKKERNGNGNILWGACQHLLRRRRGAWWRKLMNHITLWFGHQNKSMISGAEKAHYWGVQKEVQMESKIVIKYTPLLLHGKIINECIWLMDRSPHKDTCLVFQNSVCFVTVHFPLTKTHTHCLVKLCILMSPDIFCYHMLYILTHLNKIYLFVSKLINSSILFLITCMLKLLAYIISYV